VTSAWRTELVATIGAIARGEPVAGGDINDAWRVELADGRRVFVKTHASPPAGMYVAEAAGLAWLGEGRCACRAWSPRAPRSRARVARARTAQPSDRRRARSWSRSAAPPRRSGVRSHGPELPRDDRAGQHGRDRRRHALDRAARAAAVHAREARPRSAARRARAAPRSVRSAGAAGAAAWRPVVGNVVACDGAPALIDPAVYGGHREVDSRDARAVRRSGRSADLRVHRGVPLAPGWRERVGLWQLYPLAAHAVLFGGGYGAQVARILDDLT